MLAPRLGSKASHQTAHHWGAHRTASPRQHCLPAALLLAARVAPPLAGCCSAAASHWHHVADERPLTANKSGLQHYCHMCSFWLHCHSQMLACCSCHRLALLPHQPTQLSCRLWVCCSLPAGSQQAGRSQHAAGPTHHLPAARSSSEPQAWLPAQQACQWHLQLQLLVGQPSRLQHL